MFIVRWTCPTIQKGIDRLLATHVIKNVINFLMTINKKRPIISDRSNPIIKNNKNEKLYYASPTAPENTGL